MKPQRNRARDLGFYVLIMVILLAVVYTMTTPSTKEELIYSDVVDLFKNEEVKSFVITGSEIVITKRGVDPASPDATVRYELYDVGYFLYQMGDLIDQQHAEGIIEDYNLDEGFVAPWWVSMIPYLLLIGVFGSLGQAFITYAYRFAPASEISIYNYSGIIFSMILGFFILGEPVKFTSVIGGALVAAASVMVYVYNNRSNKKAGDETTK